MEFWGRKTLLLVTGASRGMGYKCAIEFCKKVAPGSVAVIAARTLQSLEPLKKYIVEQHPDLKLGLFAQNQENPDGKVLERKLGEFLAKNNMKPTDFEHAMIVHAPMTQFNLQAKALSLQSAEDLRRFFTVNTFAPVIMNSHFLSIFSKERLMMRTIVNITSDAAERPYNALSTLCAASAARESYMCSIAKENEHILVLNYNPGLLDIYVKSLKDCEEKEIKDYCKDHADKGKITTCGQTVRKLVKVLEGRQFFSGEHVDYWDLK